MTPHDILAVALTKIWHIVHVPTKKTNHRGAVDHYQADFDAIRKIIEDTRLPQVTDFDAQEIEK